MPHIPLRFRSERRACCLVACCLVALFLTVAGCGPRSPEERVTAVRAEYTVNLENFTVKRPKPVEDLGLAAEEAAAAGEAVAEAAEAAATAVEEAAEGEAGEGGDEGMEEMEETGPKPADVILHLLVRFTGEQALPGITVEVTQQDPFGKEKEPTLHWLDTANMAKNDVQQVDLKLEGVEFEDGDAFSVLLRQVVPAAERGGYREYAEAAP